MSYVNAMDWTKKCVFPRGYVSSGRARLLITGSNGLVGQAILAALARGKVGDWEVVASGRNEAQGRSKMCPYVSVDVSNRGDFSEMLRTLKPACVLHAAAMTQVDACEQQQELAYKSNVVPIKILLESLPKDCFLLHLSTDFLFDGTNSPYRENSPYTPCNYYGYTKQFTEVLLLQAAHPVAIVRTSLLYGKNESHTKKTHLLTWAKQTLEAGKPLKMINDQWRRPTFVGDLVDACLLILKKRFEGIFHVTGTEDFTPHSMISASARYWGYDEALIEAIDTNTLGQVAKRPLKTILCLENTQKKLDYRPHTLLDALKLMDKRLL